MKPLIGVMRIFASLCSTAADDLLDVWAAIASSVSLCALNLARIAWGNHGKRAAKRIRDAARDRESSEGPAQRQYLGLPDRRHRDRDHAQAQPHGARVHPLTHAR